MLHKTRALVLVLILTISFQASAATDCNQFLTGVGRVVSWPVRAAKAGFLEFWEQQKVEGPKRWWLAPRKNPEKFDHWAWFEPADLPFETISKIRSGIFKKPPLKKRLSKWVGIPLSTVVWGAGFVGLQLVTIDNQVKTLDRYLENDLFGAAYVGDWIASDQLEIGGGVKLITESRAALNRGLEPLRLRIADFQKSGLWNPEQAALAGTVIDHLLEKFKPADLTTQTQLVERAGAEAEFVKLRESLGEAKAFTLALWLAPEVSVASHTDAFWLAQVLLPEAREASWTPEQLKGLDSLAANDRLLDHALPLTTLAQMSAWTLTHPAEIEAKFQEAQKAGVSGPFVYRADFPVFGNEIPLWAQMKTDPRFSGLYEAGTSGQVSEFAVLFETEKRLEEIKEVEQVYQKAGDQPSEAQICELIYGDGGLNEPNLFFAPLQAMGGLAVQEDLARASYRTLIAVGQATTIESKNKAFEDGQAEQARFVDQLAEQPDPPPSDFCLIPIQQN